MRLHSIALLTPEANPSASTDVVIGLPASRNSQITAFKTAGGYDASRAPAGNLWMDAIAKGVEACNKGDISAFPIYTSVFGHTSDAVMFGKAPAAETLVRHLKESRMIPHVILPEAPDARTEDEKRRAEETVHERTRKRKFHLTGKPWIYVRTPELLD